MSTIDKIKNLIKRSKKIKTQGQLSGLIHDIEDLLKNNFDPDLQKEFDDIIKKPKIAPISSIEKDFDGNEEDEELDESNKKLLDEIRDFLEKLLKKQRKE